MSESNVFDADGKISKLFANMFNGSDFSKNNPPFPVLFNKKAD